MEQPYLSADATFGRGGVSGGHATSRSTLVAIMGRMAAYTGQQITWEMALNSREDLSPSGYDWEATPPPARIAVPGETEFA